MEIVSNLPSSDYLVHTETKMNNVEAKCSNVRLACTE